MSDTLKIREVNRLARDLARAVQARTNARKAVKRAEERVRDVRRRIKMLVDEDPGPTTPAPLCDDCGHPLGTTASCVACQAAHALFLGGTSSTRTEST